MYFCKYLYVLIFFVLLPSNVFALSFAGEIAREYSTTLPDQSACQTVMAGISMKPITPQFPFTIEVGYAPLRHSSGMFGYGWRSPQLESHLMIEKEKIFWITPWLQQLAFRRVGKDTRVSSPLWQSEDHLWEMAFPPVASREVTIRGKGQHEGWRFVYDRFRLSVTRIESPDKGMLRFIYDDLNRLIRIENGAGEAEFQMIYENDLVVEIKLRGKNRVRFTYEKGPIGSLISGLPNLPPMVVNETRLTSFQVNDYPKQEFHYDNPGTRPDKIEESP